MEHGPRFRGVSASRRDPSDTGVRRASGTIGGQVCDACGGDDREGPSGGFRSRPSDQGRSAVSWRSPGRWSARSFARTSRRSSMNFGSADADTGHWDGRVRPDAGAERDPVVPRTPDTDPDLRELSGPRGPYSGRQEFLPRRVPDRPGGSSLQQAAGGRPMEATGSGALNVAWTGISMTAGAHTCEGARTRRLLRLALLTSTVLACTVLACAMGGAAVAQSAAPARTNLQVISIGPGTLTAGLNRLAAQSGVEILFDAALTSGRLNQGVSGTMTAAAALDALLAGTGIHARFAGGNQVVLTAPETRLSRQDGRRSPAGLPSSASPPLPAPAPARTGRARTPAGPPRQG